MLAEGIDWDRAGKDSFVPVTFLFQHLQDAQTFYQGLVRSRKVDTIYKSGVEYLSCNIETSLHQRLKGRPLAIPIPIVANYVATELFGLLKWWLDARMPYTPGDMDKTFHRLINPTIASALTLASRS